MRGVVTILNVCKLNETRRNKMIDEDELSIIKKTKIKTKKE